MSFPKISLLSEASELMPADFGRRLRVASSQIANSRRSPKSSATRQPLFRRSREARWREKSRATHWAGTGHAGLGPLDGFAVLSEVSACMTVVAIVCMLFCARLYGPTLFCGDVICVAARARSFGQETVYVSSLYGEEWMCNVFYRLIRVIPLRHSQHAQGSQREQKATG